MKTKILEVRDRMTFLPVMATQMLAENYNQDRLLQKSGYGFPSLIMLVPLRGSAANYDPYKWNGRTLANAHKYIVEHWDELSDGDVVDVEFILGETTTKKEPEL